MPRMATARQRAHQRQQAALTSRRRYVAPAPEDAVRTPPTPTLEELPGIPTSHPTWWWVQRIELHPTGPRWVLIAECPSETEAFKIALRQRWQARVTKYGYKGPPYVTHRSPKVVTQEESDAHQSAANPDPEQTG